MDLEEIARKAITFAFLFSIIMTVIALAMISSGMEVPKEIEVVFLPTSMFISYTKSITSKLPGSPQPSDISWVLAGAAVAGAVLQFFYTMVTIFLQIPFVMASILPREYYFLVPPLVAICSFLQFCIYYYIVKKVASAIGRYISI